MPHAGQYSAIYADPAWKFLLRSALGAEKSPEAHYQCMTLDAIKALPVDEVAGPRCHLFVWTTWPMLLETFAVVEAWSDPDNPWRYVSGGSWHKKTANGLDAFGSGYLFRSSSEPILTFVRGDPKWHSRSERNSWHRGAGINAPVREHSRKPDLVRDMIERATRGPKLEMFSRIELDGWDVWGDQVGLFNDPEAVAAMKAEKAARVARRAAQMELPL